MASAERPFEFFVRTPLLDELLARWHGHSRRPIFLVGNPGSGKTALAEALVAEVRRDSGDGTYAELMPLRFGIAHATEAISQLTLSDRRGLLVLDGLDEFPPQQEQFLENFVAQTLALAQRSQSLIVVTTRPAVLGPAWTTSGGHDYEVITMPSMTRAELDDLMIRRGLTVSPEERQLIAAASDGSPLLAALLAELTKRESVDAVLERLTARSMAAVAPADESASDLADLQDFPWGADIEVRLRSVDDGLIAYLAEHPERLYDLRPRQFEELLAELYAREGFHVEMTKETRDGGIDLYLVRYESFGRVLTVVDAKRYRQDRPVSVGVVRHLYGVVEAERASAGVVATTSFFSREAKRFQESVPFRLSLQDYFDLQTMLRRAGP